MSLLFQKPHRSCAEVKQADPGADSGYYWIKIKDREVQVYCDMEKYGEFWIIKAAVKEFNYIQFNTNQPATQHIPAPFYSTQQNSAK